MQGVVEADDAGCSLGGNKPHFGGAGEPPNDMQAPECGDLPRQRDAQNPVAKIGKTRPVYIPSTHNATPI